MNGLMDNGVIEKLDLSDNDISDHDSLNIVRYLKKQAEARDNALWMTGLRHSNKDTKKAMSLDKDSEILNLILPPNSPYEVQQ